jgi:cephalosporin-C deacetylase-like acetyl esterase
MVRGINLWAERELAAAPARRDERWSSSTGPFSVNGRPDPDRARARLREILGVVDPRVRPEDRRLWTSEVITHRLMATVSARSAQWRVMDGVTAEGYVLQGTLSPSESASSGDTAASRDAANNSPVIVALPDPSWTAEQFCGLLPGVAAEWQWPRLLAERGHRVLVPTLIDRGDTFSGHPDIRFTNLPHRELVYRMAFEMGRHIIGYEVQKVLAAVDLCEAEGREVWVCGVGDGGLLALYSAAVDPRIRACLVGGYFSEREEIWREPIDRNVWSLLRDFGDAEIAGLVAPRRLVFLEAGAPEFAGPSPPRSGRADFAAPGRIVTPAPDSVRREFLRAQRSYASPAATKQLSLISGDDSLRALAAFAVRPLPREAAGQREPPKSEESNSSAAVDVSAPLARQRRQLTELIDFTQRLLHQSDKVRAASWRNADRSSLDAWERTSQAYRERIHAEMIGRLPAAVTVPRPRSRRVLDEPTHVGYEVVLDVYSVPEAPSPQGPGDGSPGLSALTPGVLAGGVLLVPRDLEPGEHRPVVVFQHGLEGTPGDTITTDESTRAWQAYKGISTQLVQRGFVVYAPQNPYRGEHAFRVIQRKSNPLGRSLFSYIIEQHRQTLRWLATLPWVDPQRIAFYGLSYGGKTAVRVPPLLPGSDQPGEPPGYCLSICSADFNEWIRKNVSSEDRYSYVFTKEYEMFEWNMGHVAGYAELATLMTPRPFMVERGHDDGVAPDEWVAWEYAKVRRHYAQLGLSDRTAIEFFLGPHTIHGRGTIEFLHRHLDWPELSHE